MEKSNETRDIFSIVLHSNKCVPLRILNMHISEWNHPMEIIDRIKVVLVEQQRTSKWLAEQLGKSEHTISKWCSNRVQPSLGNLIAIAKTLDIDVKDLLVSIK